MTDEWTRAEKRKVQSEQAKAIMDFVSMLSDKIAELERENADLRDNYDQFKASAIPEIERLQKENEELRNNGFTVSAMTEQQLKVALEKGEQLEKENAELRSGCGMCYSKDKDMLIKAKDLLNEFMRISKASDEDFEHDYSELIGEAEQFLKEIEK